MSGKRKTESVVRQVQSLERKVDAVARVCQERSVEASRKTERAVNECAKRCDLEALARNVSQLKESESKQDKEIRALAGKLSAKDEAPTREDKSPVKPATPAKRTEFICDKSKEFEGIIAHLTRKCGGNVHSEGIVDVTGAGVHDNESYPMYAVDLGEKRSCYLSANKPNSWICYDFKERRVIPKSYSVRSCGWGRYGGHLKAWVFEVSNNGTSWTEVDRREDNDALKGGFSQANFNISRVPSESFRFLRLRQTGENHEDGFHYRHGKNILALSALEIFGTLCEK